MGNYIQRESTPFEFTSFNFIGNQSCELNKQKKKNHENNEILIVMISNRIE